MTKKSQQTPQLNYVGLDNNLKHILPIFQDLSFALFGLFFFVQERRIYLFIYFMSQEKMK